MTYLLKKEAYWGVEHSSNTDKTRKLRPSSMHAYEWSRDYYYKTTSNPSCREIKYLWPHLFIYLSVYFSCFPPPIYLASQLAMCLHTSPSYLLKLQMLQGQSGRVHRHYNFLLPILHEDQIRCSFSLSVFHSRLFEMKIDFFFSFVFGELNIRDKNSIYHLGHIISHSQTIYMILYFAKHIQFCK